MEMSDHKLDRIHADDFIEQAILDAECDALNCEKRAVIGSWQCPRCYLAAMETWREEPNPDDAPACCGGEPMLPYRITPEQLNTKIVSRWIDDVERETSDAQLVRERRSHSKLD